MRCWQRKCIILLVLKREKMHDKQRSQVSLVIKEAQNQKKIKAKDPNNASTKFVEYIPFWV